MNTQNNHMSKLLQTSLIVVCAVLVIVLLVEVNRDYSTNSDMGNASLASQPLTIQGIEASDAFVAIEAYEDIINRPLFNDDRKPYVFVAPPPEEKPVRTRERPAPASKPPQQMSLTAIVITPEKSLAILQAGNNKILQRVRLGETIDGWTLAEIQDQSVVLKQGEQTQTLELEVKGSSKSQKPALAQTTSETTPKDQETSEITEKVEETTENTDTVLIDQ